MASMTVKELIEKLQKYPQNAKVEIYDIERRTYPASDKALPFIIDKMTMYITSSIKL